MDIYAAVTERIIEQMEQGIMRGVCFVTIFTVDFDLNHQRAAITVNDYLYFLRSLFFLRCRGRNS